MLVLEDYAAVTALLCYAASVEPHRAGSDRIVSGTNLVFGRPYTRPPGSAVALVFSLAPDVPVTVIAGTLRRKWTLQGSAKVSPAATRFITGTLVLRTVQAVHGSIYYDNSVWRGLGVAPVTGFDRASPANAAKTSSFEQADNLGAFPSAPWNSSVAVDALASGVHEQAQHLEGAPTASTLASRTTSKWPS
ncbi:hypothetical protein [Ralstonia mannitolilytica]|uniref:hypothetical protein n=1 Tax=Ralstonia mannitolilytica TaxID=105219 RepID=UPI00289F3131|nr:hypothetical protein [Ralstonia mannitolilytica]